MSGNYIMFSTIYKIFMKERTFILLIIWENSHHHHHVVPLARISLTLSRHFSLSFIASGRSSGLHPVSSHSCCMYVRAGRPAFARPYVGVHRSTSLMSSTFWYSNSFCFTVTILLKYVQPSWGMYLPNHPSISRMWHKVNF